MQDCGTGHGDRFKDMNGLAEMSRSQVTHVTLVFDTFKRALSPHRTCVAPALSAQCDAQETCSVHVAVVR